MPKFTDEICVLCGEPITRTDAAVWSDAADACVHKDCEDERVRREAEKRGEQAFNGDAPWYAD